MKALVTLLAVAIALGSGSSAQALERTVTASSGKEIVIARGGTAMGRASGCLSGPRPEVTVLEAPEHGKIAIRPLRFMPLSADPGGTGECVNIVPVNGIGIFYRSAPGFRGSDRVRVRLSFENRRSRRGGQVTQEYSISIIVK